MDQHLYTKQEAEIVLKSFPPTNLDELVTLAKRAKSNSGVITDHERIDLPDGWAYQMYGNAILVRYLDGEQERKPFFVPSIRIEFEYADSIEPEKSVFERLTLGFCSCGKSMPFIRLLLVASDRGYCSHRRYGGVTATWYVYMYIVLTRF